MLSLGLVAIAGLLFLVVFAIIVGLVAAVKGGNRVLVTILGVIAASPIVLVVLGWGAVRVSQTHPHSKDNRSVTLAVSKPRITVNAPIEIPAQPDSPPAPPRAEVVSEEELLAIASPDPVIEIGESDQDARPTDKDDPLASLSERMLPEWAEGNLAKNQRAFISGPFATLTQCDQDAATQLLRWSWQEIAGNTPAPEDWTVTLDEIEDRFVRTTHTENLETSVGKVYVLHTLVEIDGSEEDWLTARYNAWNQEHRRTTGIRAVTIGGGLLLGAVGLLHGILRTGGRTETT